MASPRDYDAVAITAHATRAAETRIAATATTAAAAATKPARATCCAIGRSLHG